MGVRWDAVVGDSRFWSEPARSDPAVNEAGAVASVQVWLFGSLADGLAERPLVVGLRAPFSVEDVIAELGRRCGPEFLARFTTSGGGPVRHCRVYIDGDEVEDTAAPVRIRSACTRMEMILLTAAEGG